MEFTDEEAQLLCEFGTPIAVWGRSGLLPSRPRWVPEARSEAMEGGVLDTVFLTGTSISQDGGGSSEVTGHRGDDCVPPPLYDFAEMDAQTIELRIHTHTDARDEQSDDTLDAMISSILCEADAELARGKHSINEEERRFIYEQAERLYIGVREEMTNDGAEGGGDVEEDPFDDDPLTSEERALISADVDARLQATSPKVVDQGVEDELTEMAALQLRQQTFQSKSIDEAKQAALSTVNVDAVLQHASLSSLGLRGGRDWVSAIRPQGTRSFVDPEMLACEIRQEHMECPPAEAPPQPSPLTREVYPSGPLRHPAAHPHLPSQQHHQLISSLHGSTADRFFPITEKDTLQVTEAPNNAAGVSTAAADPHSKNRKALLQRRADWESMREVIEGVLMRREDEKAMRRHRQTQAQVLIFKREQDAFYPFESKERQEVAAAEAVAFAEIRDRERRQRGVMEQFMRHKALQLQAARLSDIVANETQLRQSQCDMEHGDWSERLNHFMDEAKDILQRDSARASLLAVAVSGDGRNQLEEDEDDERRHLFAKFCRGQGEATLRLAERQAAENRRSLLEAQERRVERVRSHIQAAEVPILRERLLKVDGVAIEKEAFAKCVQLLQALKGRGALQKRPTSAPPPCTPSTNFSIGHSNRFDASAILRLYPFRGLTSIVDQTDAAAGGAESPSQAPSALSAVMAFRSLNGALEDLSGVDLESIRRCSVGVSVGGVTRRASTTTGNSFLDVQQRSSSFSKLKGMTSGMQLRQLPVAPLVEELNLSNNPNLSAPDSEVLQLAALLEVFPALQHLQLSGCGIKALETGSSSPTTEASKVVRLDVSNNALGSLPPLDARCPLLMQLNAFANPSLVPTSAVGSFIAAVEMSRTKTNDLLWLTTSLSGSSSSPLTTLDVSRTGVTDLSPLLRDSSAPFLQQLYASHCQLSDALSSSLPSSPMHPSTGIFLRHLFIGGNVSVTHLGFAPQFPSLVVLKAESCSLQSIEGIKGCPLLETLDVSFNDLDTFESLIPIGMCGALRVLNINENPITKDGYADSVCAINGRDGTLAGGPKGFVLGICPSLAEFGNELVSDAEKAAAMAAWGTVEGSEDAESLLPSLNRLKAALAESKASLSAVLPPTWIRLLSLLHKEYTAVSLVLACRFQRAVAAETGIQKRVRAHASAPTYNPPPDRSTTGVRPIRSSRLDVGLLKDSNTAWVEMMWGRVALLSQHLRLLCAASKSTSAPEDVINGLQSASDGGTVDALLMRLGCGDRSPWDGLPLAMTAWGIVSKFLRGRILIQRAKRELANLKATSSMYADAATKISSTWRGHRVRRRLKGVLSHDDDDDGLYNKVAWSEPEPLGQPGGVSGFMRSTFASHGSAPQVFKVSPATADAQPVRVGSAPGIPPHTMGNVRLTGGGFVSGVRGLVGSGSAWDGEVVPTEAERPSSVPTPPPPRDEWTTAMRAHLHNKQAKINKQHQATLRKEYIADPLKAKTATKR